MKVTITFIELKGPFKFFILSKHALKIIKQLRATNCMDFKKKGLWTKHYTMTLWSDEQALKDFSLSGAHLEAMRLSKKMAREIRTITIDAEVLPSWDTAIKHLENAKILSYK